MVFLGFGFFFLWCFRYFGLTITGLFECATILVLYGFIMFVVVWFVFVVGLVQRRNFRGFGVCCSLWAFGLFGCCADALFELFCGVVCLPENYADFTSYFRLLCVGY